MFVYSISRDEKSSLAKWIDSYRAESQKTWEHRNTLRTDISEQAARDRHLFTTSQKDPGYELRTPECVFLYIYSPIPSALFLAAHSQLSTHIAMGSLSDCMMANSCPNRLIDSGSPNNVPAGHYANLDKVIEHYRKQHLDEEARKAKKLELSKTEQ
jgi:hypothetical protein